MTDTPTPGNRPTPGAPTPGSVNKEVPAEAWKRGLAETAEAPAAERHTALSALLDDLETQVGSL